MGRFSKRIAQTLARAGFHDAASKLKAQAWLVEGKISEGRREQVKLGGHVFSLTSKDGLHRLAETILSVEKSRPVYQQAVKSPLKPKTGLRVAINSAAMEAERESRWTAELTAAIENRIAPYQDNPWFPLTSPYRLWQKALTDKKAMAENLRQWATPRQVAERLLSGVSGSYHASMERLRELERCNVICDLWTFLTSRPTQHATQSVELLASVGACPLPIRAKALRRSLPTLVASLLAAEMRDSEPGTVLQALFGARRQLRDLQILEQVHRTAREELGESAASLIETLLRQWTAKAGTPSAGAPTRTNDWSGLRQMMGPVPMVPDEVMRSLLEAALRKGWEKPVYALPEVEYWVRVQDRLLTVMGVERFRFVLQGPQAVQVICAPSPVTFPLEVPPLSIQGGSLYIALMAALAYTEMVTRRDRLQAERGGVIHVLQVGARKGTRRAASNRPVRVGRVSGTDFAATHRGRTVATRAASYVVPHLRWLHVGEASANALAEAAEHGIRIPDGYTFVRGHFRGDGAGDGAPEYNVVDVALETVRRFQAGSR